MKRKYPMCLLYGRMGNYIKTRLIPPMGRHNLRMGTKNVRDVIKCAFNQILGTKDIN